MKFSLFNSFTLVSFLLALPKPKSLQSLNLRVSLAEIFVTIFFLDGYKKILKRKKHFYASLLC